MKKLLLFNYLIFALISISLSSATFSPKPLYRFTYSLTFQYNRTDASTTSTEDVFLYSNGLVSKYGSKNRLMEDSIKSLLIEAYERTGTIDGSISLPQTHFKSIIYKNATGIDVYESLLAQSHHYTTKRDHMVWKIGQEQATIAGFSCLRADGIYAGREYTAWFTTDIPVSDGPYVFCNLPGLIVKIYDSEQHYLWELKKVEPLKSYPSLESKPQNAIRSSRKEILEVKNMQSSNPGHYLNQLGSFSDEHRRMYIEKYSQRNNPIERE